MPPLPACFCWRPPALSLGFVRWDVTAGAIGSSGTTMVAYSVLRAVLAIVILAACVAAGLVTRRYLLRAPAPTRYTVPLLLCDFAAGAALLALTLICLGFAGLLYRPVVWAITAPLLAALPFLAVTPAGARPTLGVGITSAEEAVHAVLLVLNAGAAIFLLAYRGLFPSEIDGDVWEHYLHYFYEVTQTTHSLWPGDLWIHFFTSKGATLQMLAILLTDVMAPQVVSWCFVIFMALIAWDVTRTLTGKSHWGLVASLAVLESAAIFDLSPNFMKHHIVFAGLAGFVGWCVARGLRARELPRRFVLFAGASACAYAAFYLPVGGGIIITGLTAAALVALALRLEQDMLRGLGVLALAAGAGSASALALNYLVTGLALDSPVGLFWGLADHERFATLWSPLVVEYWFLGAGSVESVAPSLGGMLIPKFSWLHEVLRLRYLRPLWWLLPVAVVLCLAALARRAHGHPSGNASGFATLAAFLAGALLLANAFPSSDSVYRLYAFASTLVLVLGTTLIGGAVQLALPVPAASIAALLAALFVSHTLLGNVSGERLKTVRAYLLGRMPMERALALNDRYSDLPGGFANFQAARAAAPGQRVLYMGYSPSPGYLLPPPPLLSEPSYAFGSGYDRIVYGPAADAEALLRAHGVNYFLFNMRSRLFLGIPYSELFDAAYITRRIGLHWSRDEFYLLTWKEDAATPLPAEFVVMLEFKQRSIFAGLKTEFPKRLAAVGASNAEALRLLEEYLLERLKSAPARSFVEAFAKRESARPRPSADVALALRDFAAQAWGEPIARALWDLRLSEDIQSQDFGWLHERNRSRYTPGGGK